MIIADNDQEVLHTDGDTAIAYTFRYELVQIVVTLEKLNAIFKSVIRRQEDKIDPIRSRFGTIEKEEVSLSEKMLELKEFAGTHKKFSFRALLENQRSRIQVIVTFLSVLELMKMRHSS